MYFNIVVSSSETSKTKTKFPHHSRQAASSEPESVRIALSFLEIRRSPGFFWLKSAIFSAGVCANFIFDNFCRLQRRWWRSLAPFSSLFCTREAYGTKKRLVAPSDRCQTFCKTSENNRVRRRRVKRLRLPIQSRLTLGPWLFSLINFTFDCSFFGRQSGNGLWSIRSR